MNQVALEKLLTYIPVLESGILTEAASIYVSTGTYIPPMQELATDLKNALEAADYFDWTESVETYRVFMNDPRGIREVDYETARKLLVVAATPERFNKSLFPHLCGSGFMLELLQRFRSLST